MCWFTGPPVPCLALFALSPPFVNDKDALKQSAGALPLNPPSIVRGAYAVPVPEGFRQLTKQRLLALHRLAAMLLSPTGKRPSVRVIQRRRRRRGRRLSPPNILVRAATSALSHISVLCLLCVCPPLPKKKKKKIGSYLG